MPRPALAKFNALLAAAALAALTSGCRPDYPKCKSDDHCSDKGEVCVEGLCKQCSTDANCAEGFLCQDSACVALPECRADADCGEGRRCRGTKCVPQCETSRECASGEKCENNRCVAAPECTTESDCATGKGCREGKCVEVAAPNTGVTAPVDDAEARRRAQLEACQLERVPFEFNEFALSDAARASLDRNAECIRHKNRAVAIEGHADERGTDEYNLVLAEKRANAAKRYLAGLGLEDGKLKTVSYGEERPLDGAHNDDAWAKNRRVELSFR